MRHMIKTAAAGVMAVAALITAAGTAHADSWDPWLPGVPNIGGPGVNIGIPGNPLPPGQVKNSINDLIPNFNGNGKWK